MSLRPVMLTILDGWGIAPPGPGNAVELARTPNLDRLSRDWPHCRLICHGQAVGLPEGQMGNSEVGHLNIGAGRVVHQDISRIDRAIASGRFKDNEALVGLMDRVGRDRSSLHLLGLVSDGGVHSSLTHLRALVEMAKARGLEKVFIHAFMDGRDTPPDSGLGYLEELQEFLKKTGLGTIAGLGGRYWGMDRDKRWDRVSKYYDALVRGRGRTAADPLEAVRQAYESGETDEFITPTMMVDHEGKPRGLIRDNDGVVFFNFRADRAREITEALALKEFDGFDRGPRLALSGYVTMTLYDASFDLPVAFPPVRLENILGEIISNAGKRQLRIAETEKYAHVTYFFNGGLETPFEGEDRALIPSPREVETYDLKPQMSAFEVCDRVLAEIDRGVYDFIVLNFANGDMVGHTGILKAAIAACETVDECVGRIAAKILGLKGTLMVTADHGNAERMIDEEGHPYTAHSRDNPVPFILAGAGRPVLREEGRLGDIAPTVLQLMDLEQPPAMTGKSLLRG